MAHGTGSAPPADLVSSQVSRPLAGRHDAVLVDLDGVVYRGDHVVARAPESLDAVRGLGVKVLFLTNNSARTPEQVAEKLNALGVRAEPHEVLTSAIATGAMLRHQVQDRRGDPVTSFVIGERGVRDALEAAGVVVLDSPDHADLVVVGWDRSVDYVKLRTAALLVQRGARLVATNADASYPAPDGLWPGAGAILAAVTTTTGAKPTVVGKPFRPLFEAAAEVAGATRPLVVGDRLDTDIKGASTMGWDSLLVLTGAAARRELPLAESLPTYLGQDLSTLLGEVPPARFRPARADDEADVVRLLRDAHLSTEGVAERIPDTIVVPGMDEREAQAQEHSWDAGGERVAGGERDAGRERAVGAVPGRGALATASLDGLGGVGLLRSVAVAPEARGLELGTLISAAAIRMARERGHSQVALFTETAGPFFERLGFRPVDRDDLPKAVRDSRQAREECAASALPMILDLPSGGPSAAG